MTLREMYRKSVDERLPLCERYKLIRLMVLRRKLIELKKVQPLIPQKTAAPEDLAILKRVSLRRKERQTQKEQRLR